MGWVCLAALSAGAFIGTRALGVPRHLGAFVGAAIMLAAAGYAVQARPGMPAADAQPADATDKVDPTLSELRLDMFGRHTRAEQIFYASDALIRSGANTAAVSILLGGVNANPRDAAMWAGLGSAYAINDGNRVSPASRFAFARAMQLAPRHPGPPFFLGVSLVRAGEFREARLWWSRAFLLSPDISFRAQISERLTLLERFLESPAGQDGR